MREIKVLLIAYACEPNKGSEPGVGWNWAIHLSKNIDVTVVTRRNNRASIENVLLGTPNNRLKFIYHDLPILVNVKKISRIFLNCYYLLWVLSLRILLRNVVHNSNFDIIHFVTFNSFAVTPPIYGFNSGTVWGPIGGGILGEPLESFKKLGYLSFWKEQMRFWLISYSSKRFIKKNISHNFDRCIFANSNTATLLNIQNPLVELETGINANNLAKTAEREVSSIINIFTAAVLEARKGIHVLIESLCYLKCDVKLTIAGNGPARKKLEILVEKLHRTNVTFLGRVDYSIISKYYLQSDIFVFPSLRDTSGNVILEAMSQGLPIITFDHHGSHDILTDDCGVRIPVTSHNNAVKDLSEAIDKLATDRELRIMMGTASINRIKSTYLWDLKAAKMTNFYRNIINERSANT